MPYVSIFAFFSHVFSASMEKDIQCQVIFAVLLPSVWYVGQIGTSLYIALYLLAKRFLFILKNVSREWLLDIKQFESCNATLDFCLALVSKSSFTYDDSTGSVFCISTELFCTSSLQHACCMPMWKRCYKYNSTVGTVVVLCVCGWGRVCLCWLVRSSSCTCRTWPSYWTVALF